MKFIKGLLSTIIVAAGLFWECVAFSMLTSDTYPNDTKVFAIFFGILIVFPVVLFLKWLWRKSIKEVQTVSDPTNSPEILVKVPVGIQYKLELSSPDPSTTPIPEILSSQYEFSSLQSFPKSLFRTDNYNGGKFLVALLLFIATIYFLTGCLGFIFIQNDWIEHETSGFISFIWNSIVGNDSSTKISSTVDLFIRSFIFICSYCLAWMSFGPK
jgi:hypothetical protein